MKPTQGPLDGQRPVRPPAALRANTLAAAERALEARTAEADFWTRIYRSRPLRLAWAAGVIALVAAHVTLSLPRRAPRRASVIFPILAEKSEPEVVEVVRLAPIDPLAPDFTSLRLDSKGGDGS